jgi:hypothetical protein
MSNHSKLSLLHPLTSRGRHTAAASLFAPPHQRPPTKQRQHSAPGTSVILLDMAAMDSPPFTKQGELKKLAGSSNSEWQACSFALMTGHPSTLRFSSASATSGGSASSSDGNGCIALPSSSAAAATPGTSTDFTVTNAEHAHEAVLGQRTLQLRADTQCARDEWVAAINAEIRRAAGSGGAAAASALTSPSAPVVYSFGSLYQESPPADVVDLGKRDQNRSSKKRQPFTVLTLKELRLLAAKMHSSPNVKVLNLKGQELSEARMSEIANALGKLTALQEMDLSSNLFLSEGMERLAEALGKLTALQKLNLRCTVGGLFRGIDYAD